MTGDRLPTYQNAVPEAAIEAVAKQILGVKLHAWSKAESGRMCGNFERQRRQLDDAVQAVQDRLDELDLDDFEVPEVDGKPTMTRLQYKRKEQETLQSLMAANIASLDRLTTIYNKLTAGGLGAMLAGIKQSSQLKQQEQEEMHQVRNVTPRRPLSAGAIQVMVEE